MAILINEDTRVLVQGITGKEGTFHTQQMLAYGTKVVAGVTPGKGGQKVEGVPVFNTVEEAVKETGANASVIFVPAPFACDAIYEAVDAGIKLIVCITEGIPTLDMMKVKRYLEEHPEVVVIGPNCPGLICPPFKCKMGIMPGHIHTPGPIGVISRSGTLTYEIDYQLTLAGLGQSTCIGIGGDQIPGTNFIDLLKLFNEDEETKGVVMVGEIGGTAEEEAAAWIKANFKKPVVAFIAGRTAPPGKRMGHAGAIISGGQGTAESKIKALREAGIFVAEDLGTLGKTVKEVMGL
jgi:succinyl-CoA synthetase alpha subunit